MKPKLEAVKCKQMIKKLRWSELDPAYLKQLIDLAREEDLEGAGLLEAPAFPGDVTVHLLETHTRATAKLVARQNLTFCGSQLIEYILTNYGGGSYKPQINDGQEAATGDILGILEANASVLLQAERVILNFLQHLSGIATHVESHVNALGNTHTKLLDTRKTTPGYRALEKYAVACGGAWNHRMGLFDRIMVKDNHLAFSGLGSLPAIVRRARELHPDIVIEVEVDNFEQIETVLDTQPDVILLDNFGTKELAEAVAQIGNKALTEASGGITLDTLPELAGLGLDCISCGSMVHASKWVDIGLDWEP